MSQRTHVSQDVSLAPELPHDFAGKMPKRNPSWLPTQFSRLKSPGDASPTQKCRLVWSGLSILTRAACWLLWGFCLRVCLRGRDLSSLHPHTLKGCVVALGTLLFVVCTFAASLRSKLLRSKQKSRGSILPCSVSPSSRLDSKQVEFADKYAKSADPSHSSLLSSRLDSRAVEFADEYTTTSSPARTMLPSSSSSSPSSSRLCAITRQTADTYTAVPALPEFALSSSSSPSAPRFGSTPVEVEEYIAVQGPSGTVLYAKSQLQAPPINVQPVSLRPSSSQPASKFDSRAVELADEYTTAASSARTTPRRWRRSLNGSSSSVTPSWKQVQFAVKYTTVPGEKMFIIGSSMELGSWDISRSVPMEWTDGNVWVAKVNIDPAATLVEYKYVVISNRKTVWENGSNHVFEVGDDFPPCRLDVWGAV
jgi:hypothetical protein